MYWGLAINTSVGYASIEVGAMAIPSIFWNFDEQADFASILKQTDNLMMVYNRTEDFVEANLKYLNDEKLLAELSVKQHEYFIDRHNIKDRIKNFEDYVVSIYRKRASATENQ